MYKEDRIYQHSVVMIDGKKYYVISFIDVHGDEINLEVNQEVYELLRDNNRNEARVALSDRRHMVKTELVEQELLLMEAKERDSTETCFINSLDSKVVASALNSLPEVQRRRFLQFHIHGLTQRDIAEMEETSPVAIHLSIKCAEKNLRKLLKDFY